MNLYQLFMHLFHIDPSLSTFQRVYSLKHDSCNVVLDIKFYGLQKKVAFKAIVSEQQKKVQSRPIKMRTPILHLANHWTKFKMLLTSNRFLYLIRFLLLSFPLIPQFIAQFRSICLFLCSSPYFWSVATK